MKLSRKNEIIEVIILLICFWLSLEILIMGIKVNPSNGFGYGVIMFTGMPLIGIISTVLLSIINGVAKWITPVLCAVMMGVQHYMVYDNSWWVGIPVMIVCYIALLVAEIIKKKTKQE